MQSYVAGFMFDPTGTLVVLIQKKTPIWQAGLLNAVGGKIEPGEEPLGAMAREFHEEAGVVFHDWHPFVRLYRKETYEVHFYTAFTELMVLSHTKTDEPILHMKAARLFDPDVRKDYPTIPNLQWLIPLALDRNVGRGRFIDIEDVAGN